MGVLNTKHALQKGQVGEHLALEPLGSDGIILLWGCRGLLDLDHTTGCVRSSENDQDVGAVLGDVILGEGGHVPVQLGGHQGCLQVSHDASLKIILTGEVGAFGEWVNRVRKQGDMFGRFGGLLEGKGPTIVSASS